MEHHLDEGMKEVLVYSRTNTDGHVDWEEVPKIEVEVDLAGSHSRLALGTESPLSTTKSQQPVSAQKKKTEQGNTILVRLELWDLDSI